MSRKRYGSDSKRVAKLREQGARRMEAEAARKAAKKKELEEAALGCSRCG